MRMLISFVLVVLVAGVLSAWANAGYRAEPTSASIAAIADRSTSWAEFSSKVPDLRAAPTQDTPLVSHAKARHAASKHR